MPIRVSLPLLATLVAGALACASPASGPPMTGTEPQIIAVDEQGLLSNQPGSVMRSTGYAAPSLDLPGSPWRALEALAGAYKELGIPVTVADTAPIHRIGNARFMRMRRLNDVVLSQLVRCGEDINGSRADRDRIVMSVLSEVRPQGADSSRVVTRLTATAQDTQSGTSGADRPCTSTGVLESRLHEAARRAAVSRR
jgi:hypothetical protein